MTVSDELRKRIKQKYGSVIDLDKDPSVLDNLLDDIRTADEASSVNAGKTTKAARPFGVSWMDSWVAHWLYGDQFREEEVFDEPFRELLNDLVNHAVSRRIDEIRRFIAEQPSLDSAPPDGGPPEPGVPPAPTPEPGPVPGPASFVTPDGGPPEPGVPPAGPAPAPGPESFVTPDGGPPEPGVPPGPGPEAGFLRDNPWILYWFLSIQAPLLLDVIDVHLTRRVNDLMGRTMF